MQINMNISYLYLYYIIIVLSLGIFFLFIKYKFKIFSIEIVLLITFLTYCLYFNNYIFEDLINKNYLKIKSQNINEVESDFKIENKYGFNYIIEIKDNVRTINSKKVNLIYDLDKNMKPYYETKIYDAIIFNITVVNVYLNKE